MTRSIEEVAKVSRLLDAGLTVTEAARVSGVPRSTVNDWKGGRCNQSLTQAPCPGCFDWEALPAAQYAYLLGMYLGDGCISPHPRTYKLRIYLDAAYRNIIDECCHSISAVLPGKNPWIGDHPKGRCVEICSYSRHWPCLLPQHGHGRKHLRKIELASWQDDLLASTKSAREGLLRGLIHSDGTRIIATERKGNYVRRAPRYQLSNLSDDIKQLFCDNCDALGVRWTRSSDKHISIYRLASVAKLDEFIGPKS